MTSAKTGAMEENQGQVLSMQNFLNKTCWLVKVPRYLSDEWKRRPSEIVGQIQTGPGEKIRLVSMMKPKQGSSTSIATMNRQMQPGSDGNNAGVSRLVSRMTTALTTNDETTSSGIPHEHEMKIQSNDGGLIMLVAKEDRRSRASAAESAKVVIDGRVTKRVDVRPMKMDDSYLKLKIEALRKANQPKRQIKTLEKVEQKFKPIQATFMARQRQTQQAQKYKAVRADRDLVINKVFEAFETHEYYRLQDLQQLTKQPPGYLKEILNDIAIYHQKPPHRAMWQLKEEYRAYSKDSNEEKMVE